MNDKENSIIFAQWQIWYQDTFDRETPRQVEVEGQGLVYGLVELWSRHLQESVTTSGGEGFSRFNLWWQQEATSIVIEGTREGMVRLRSWIFSSKKTGQNKLDESARDLLWLVAEAHSRLILKGKTSEWILSTAASAKNRTAFIKQLADLTSKP